MSANKKCDKAMEQLCRIAKTELAGLQKLIDKRSKKACQYCKHFCYGTCEKVRFLASKKKEKEALEKEIRDLKYTIIKLEKENKELNLEVKILKMRINKNGH